MTAHTTYFTQVTALSQNAIVIKLVLTLVAQMEMLYRKHFMYVLYGGFQKIQ